MTLIDIMNSLGGAYKLFNSHVHKQAIREFAHLQYSMLICTRERGTIVDGRIMEIRPVTALSLAPRFLIRTRVFMVDDEPISKLELVRMC